MDYTKVWNEIFDALQGMKTFEDIGRAFQHIAGYSAGLEMDDFKYYGLVDGMALERHANGDIKIDSIVGGLDKYATIATRVHGDGKVTVVQPVPADKIEELHMYVLGKTKKDGKPETEEAAA